MSREKLLLWVRQSLESLRDDVYLLEHDVSERCITAKLGCYMHCHLPSLIGDATGLPSERRLHVDCEYNRFGDDTKWFPWNRPIFDEVGKEIFYTPIPDIILHRRGGGGPHVLVVEAKKESKVSHFTALIDRLKLIGYLGPNMNYAYGLYLSLGLSQGKLVVTTAELVEHKTAREAMSGEGECLWSRATKLVETEFNGDGRVFLCRVPDKEMQTRAGEICSEIVKVFSFTDVLGSLLAEESFMLPGLLFSGSPGSNCPRPR